MQTIQFQEQRLAPSKVVCIGRNYLAHIQELNNAVPEQAVFFMKPNSAISEHLAITTQEVVSYEAELCFIIQQQRIAGVGIGLDLTKRHIQTQLKERGLPWERAKAFDGAAVLSSFVPFAGKSEALSFRLFINDKLVQQGHVSEMMHSPEAIVGEARRFLSFEDNDIVMTGTPKGVGQVNVGDEFMGQVFHGEQLLLSQSWYASVRC